MFQTRPCPTLITESEESSVFRPDDYSLAALDALLDLVVAWITAPEPLRQPTPSAAY